MRNPMQCVCGWLRASDLETCGHYACEAYELGWGPLVLRKEEPSGWRHYLNGEPVHCGAGLLLLYANGDPAHVGGSNDREAILRVRYESPLATSAQPPALLYFDAHGHEALIRAHSGMRLRWPHREMA